MYIVSVIHIHSSIYPFNRPCHILHIQKLLRLDSSSSSSLSCCSSSARSRSIVLARSLVQHHQQQPVCINIITSNAFLFNSFLSLCSPFFGSVYSSSSLNGCCNPVLVCFSWVKRQVDGYRRYNVSSHIRFNMFP